MEEVPIQNEHFSQFLNTLAEQLPQGWEVYSAMSENGLHVMGCRMKGEDARSAPTLIQIPGFCHKGSAFRKTWLPHALDGIQTHAITPPGTSPSIGINRPIEKWGIADYLEPISEAADEMARKRDFLVIEGHSLGGLLALLVATRAQQNSLLKGKTKAWIGINSIKPPNVAQRLQPFEFPDKSEEMDFRKHPQLFLEWANGLFDAQTVGVIDQRWAEGQMGDGSAAQKEDLNRQREEALRIRETKLPKDFEFIVEDRKSCRGPRNMVNDYGYGVWAIGRKNVNIPLLDINGALDREEISGVKKDTVTKNILEPARIFADNSNIRTCIAQYYSLDMSETILTKNEKSFESAKGNPEGIQSGPRQNWGWQAVLKEGTHNSPIELEKHVELTREVIRDFLKEVMGQHRDTDDFFLFYK
jgi:pimeloyl-ACP methyl ester carboxylesterase